MVFFTNLSLTGFQVRYLALFPLFSVIGSFRWFWMRNFHKNIQLMLQFLKGPFLVVHFSYYTLMAFLMLSVTLLLMLMILFSWLKFFKDQVFSDKNQQLRIVAKPLWFCDFCDSSKVSFLNSTYINRWVYQHPLKFWDLSCKVVSVPLEYG